MRAIIRKLGRVKTVVALTLASVLASVLVTYILALLSQYIVEGPVRFDIFIAVSILVPATVAPFFCWPLVSLVLKIDMLEAEMRRQVTYDELTSLYTRRALLQAAETYLELAEREQRVFSILVIDLDKFKAINDSYGHAAGDEVLRSFSQATEEVLRRSDIIGRTGGEEFAAVLPNTSKEEAYELGERLHSKIRNSSVQYEGESICYTVSMGIASSTVGTRANLEEMFKQADKALYMAKEANRNQTVLFE